MHRGSGAAPCVRCGCIAHCDLRRLQNMLEFMRGFLAARPHRFPTLPGRSAQSADAWAAPRALPKPQWPTRCFGAMVTIHGCESV